MSSLKQNICLDHANVNFSFETCGPAFQAIPSYFESLGYKNPDNGDRTALQVGHGIDVPVFEWFAANPKNLGYFLEWMPAQREDMASWLDTFPM